VRIGTLSHGLSPSQRLCSDRCCLEGRLSRRRIWQFHLWTQERLLHRGRTNGGESIHATYLEGVGALFRIPPHQFARLPSRSTLCQTPTRRQPAARQSAWPRTGTSVWTYRAAISAKQRLLLPRRQR